VTRFSARRAAMTDTNLSMNARHLYSVLDDLAADVGACWPHQKTLARMLGKSVRRVNYALSELRESGFISSRKHQKGSCPLYLLTWQTKLPNPAVSKNESAESGSFKVPNPAVSKRPILNMTQASLPNVRTTRCEGCGKLHEGDADRICDPGYHSAIHRPTEHEPLDVMVEATAMLYDAARRAHLGKPEPDAPIVAATLAAAGGLAALQACLRRLAHERQAPTKSYAWFPKVISGMIGRKTA
jgi:Helix-turn-helix domain